MTDPRDSDWGPWRLDPATRAMLIVGICLLALGIAVALW
jgi:hypothetical protein